MTLPELTPKDEQDVAAALHVEIEIVQMSKGGNLPLAQAERALAEHRKQTKAFLSPSALAAVEIGLRSEGILKYDLTPVHDLNFMGRHRFASDGEGEAA